MPTGIRILLTKLLPSHTTLGWPNLARGKDESNSDAETVKGTYALKLNEEGSEGKVNE